MTQHIAFYGKAGVGNTTLVANIGAALMEAGFIVEFVEQLQAFERNNPDYVLYDLSGSNSPATLDEVVHQVDLNNIFVVTTADFKALQFANDAFALLKQYNDERSAPIPLGGLILNNISSSFEEAFVKDFACHINAGVIGKVPRSLLVRQSELCGSTVIESSPRSSQSYYYRSLANRIVDSTGALRTGKPPQAMSPEELRAWGLEWANRIYALENGLVEDGAAI